MMNASTKMYLGGFILTPALVLLVLLTFFSFNMWLVLTMLLLFSFGVVLGPAFLGGPDE